MKKITFFLAVFTMLIFSCDNDVNINVPDPNNFPPNSSNCTEGFGPVVTQSRTMIDPFQRIETVIYADVFLSQGTFEDIVFEGQQNILDEIRSTVVNGKLVLDLEGCINTSTPIKVYITLPEIESIIQKGVGDIVFENDFVGTDLLVDLEGVGDMTLRGAVEVLDIELDPGVGNIHAFDMVSDLCEVRLEGVGDVEVFVNDELEVTIGGVGNVYYKGDPNITMNISGSGSVIDAN